MKISLEFSPADDKHDDVTRVVDAVYGVNSSPKQQVSVDALATAQPTVVVEASQASPASVAAQVAEFPNPTIAPTAAASATPATNGPAGVDLDKNGIPWDARIHSGGVGEDGKPKKTAAGVWAKRKGVDDLTVSTVTKELQNLMAAQIGKGKPPAGLPVGGVVNLGNPVNVPHQEAVPLPNDPNAFVAQPIQPAPTAAATQIAPMPQAAPVLAPNVAPMPVPMPQAAAAPTDFNSLAIWLAPNLEGAGGKLSNAHVEHFCRQCNIVDANGVGDFSLVAARPDAVAWLHQAFTAQLAAM